MSKTYKIAGIGELLWDVLPEGRQLGGAPCNFAFHSLQAGIDSYVVSAVGKDTDGEDILHVMDQLELTRSFVQITPDYPTGTVTVKLDQAGIPDYIIHEDVAWDHIQWSEEIELLAKDVDAVCFGSLAQRNTVSKKTMVRFLEYTKPDCLRVFDINLRQTFYNPEGIVESLEFANVLKLNEDELPIVGEFLGYNGDEESLLLQIMENYHLQLIAYTKGSLGSLLVTREGKSFCKVPVIEVADTVGAGDSFTAILVAGMLNGIELKTIHYTATDVAAYVCTQHGATPTIPEKIIKSVKI
jgi:fructokinase